MLKVHEQNSGRQRGFTIVELLIVIVVIGILAALVLNAFSGVQAKARDTERDTDMRALASQLEAYYTSYGEYPPTYANNTTAGTGNIVNVSMDSDVTAKLKGMDLNSLRSPSSNNTANNILFATYTAASPPAPTAAATASVTTTTIVAGPDKYIYMPTQGTNGAGSLCSTEAQTCMSFRIYYVREGATATVVTKASLN